MRKLRVQRIVRDGVSLALWDEGGNGFPIVFQHGLCGDVEQVREAFPDVTGTRLISLESRGHGASEIGPYSDLSLARFADDVLRALEHLGVREFAIGGISMGAAIALKVAVMRQSWVKALVLARPAWAFRPEPQNISPNGEVGRLLQHHNAEKAAAIFKDSETAAMLRQEAPDNLASLERILMRRPRSDTAELLVRISQEGLGLGRESVAALQVPCLIIANGLDFIHPIAVARELANALPQVTFQEIAPKALDRARHFSELHQAVKDFILRTKT